MARAPHISWLLGAALAAVVLSSQAAPATACCICGAPPPTLAQDIGGADVAVVVRLIALPAQTDSNAGQFPMAKFAVLEVLKGGAVLGSVKQIEAPFFDEQPPGGEYLILGVQPAPITWAPPYSLTPRSRRYVTEILKLPASGADRLAYFQEYLDDKEDLLSRDAFNEFALAPYSDLQHLKHRMHHDVLVKQIQNPEVTPSRRRLYLTMLSVCGGRDDLPLLERLLRSNDPKLKSSLDATVACYLMLTGADGLPLIDRLFLKTKGQADFTDEFSAIMGLRYVDLQGQDTSPRKGEFSWARFETLAGPLLGRRTISRERLEASMRLVLDDPQLADQAVIDLARWQDWSVIDRMAELFRNKDPQAAAFVRVPVINYLRACPLPRAKTLIEELRKIDPKSVATSELQYAISTPAATDPAASGGVYPRRADAATPSDFQSAPAPAPDPLRSIPFVLTFWGVVGGAMLLAAALLRRAGKNAAARVQQ